MNKARKNKILLILISVVILSLVIFLILYALRQNINLFYSPTDLKEKTASLNKTIRVGGMVMPNSLVREKDSLRVSFKITDYENILEITTEEILPVLFREGQGIVALGKLTEDKQFFATEVLAKHDENYMPPEVRDSLKDVANVS